MQFDGIVALCGSNESDGGESAVAPGFGDLPGSFLLALPSYLDARSKKAWRLVCRKADQHVCQSMTALAWHGVKSSTPMRGTKQQQQQDTAGPSSLDFAARCHKLRQLRCHNLPCLTDLGSPPPSLEVLLLKDCCGISDFSPLTQCTALRELQLSLPLKAVRRMESHSTDPAPLLSAITPLTRLQQLSLGLRRMQPAGADAVVATLRAFPSLQQLALTHGDFSRACTALAQALGSLGRLTQLRLSHCGIGPAGMLLLAPALRRLTELRELVLSHNQLGDDGVEALAPALPDLQQLTALYVNENDFTYNGAAVLAQVGGLCAACAGGWVAYASLE